jgi:hypothetical protein
VVRARLSGAWSSDFDSSTSWKTFLGTAGVEFAIHKYPLDLFHAQHPFPSDSYNISPEKTELFIRRHKTHRTTGDVTLELPKDAEELFKLWVLKYRPVAVHRTWH